MAQDNRKLLAKAHSTKPHKLQGLVPGPPGPGPTFLASALETRSSLEPQASHGKGLRVGGCCGPEKEGGPEGSAEGQHLCFFRKTLGSSSLGHVSPVIAAQGPQNKSGCLGSLANPFLPLGLPHIWDFAPAVPLPGTRGFRDMGNGSFLPSGVSH